MPVASPDHIILIGFMGAGKSSVARRLARQERMSSIDMDTYIAREAKMGIPEIFASEGEAGFRAREQAFLESMRTRERCILSCGGGTVTRAASRELLKQLGTIIWLQVEADEAVARISRPESRPLLSGQTPPAELLAERLRYYQDAADICVDTSGKSLYQVTQAVRQALRAEGKL
ncbi:MAG: shikimate kinase, partial [Coriobacteriales bacterium]|nr:shikimate kinase [Coriobacteriales bacterium]